MSTELLNILNRSQVNDFIIINDICTAFFNNARMKLLVGNINYSSGLNVIISYCYFLVKKLNGVFVSQNDSAFLLYYKKSEFRKSFSDFIHYLYLAFRVIGLKRLPSIFVREKTIKATRQKKAEEENDKDYLYVWFLAQKKEVKGIEGLLEAKQFIIQQAKKEGLALYLETTEERLVNIYKRIGFRFYDCILDETSGMKVWFARCNPNK